MNTIFSLFTFCLFANALGQVWNRLNGRFEHVSARNGIPWATTETSSVMYTGTNGWTLSTGGGQYVASATDNRAWLLRTDLWSENVYRYNPSIGFFEHISNSTLRQISAADGDNAVGVDFRSFIWQWKNNTWTQLPGKAHHVTMGSDREIYSVDLKFYMNHFVNGQWQQVIGSGVAYVEAEDQNHIAFIDTSQNVYVFDGSNITPHPGQQCVKAFFSLPYLICQDVGGSLWYTSA